MSEQAAIGWCERIHAGGEPGRWIVCGGPLKDDGSCARCAPKAPPLPEHVTEDLEPDQEETEVVIPPEASAPPDQEQGDPDALGGANRPEYWRDPKTLWSAQQRIAELEAEVQRLQMKTHRMAQAIFDAGGTWPSAEHP